MDTDVFVIIINPNDSTYTDTLTSAREIKVREQKLLVFQILKVMFMIIGLKFQKLMKYYIQFQKSFQYNY